MWISLATAAPSTAEPDRSSTVWAIVALLVVLGVALVMLAVWLVRVTRVDPELLSPLERMGDRRWREADPVWQRRELDELRPEGAEPLARMAQPPDLDEAFDAGPQAPGFDDLRSEGLAVPVHEGPHRDDADGAATEVDEEHVGDRALEPFAEPDGPPIGAPGEHDEARDDAPTERPV